MTSSSLTSNARDFIRLLNVDVHPGLIVLREAGLSATNNGIAFGPQSTSSWNRAMTLC
jgi:hypothetical protein